MPRFEQYEVWQQVNGKWEFVASFVEYDVAYDVFRNRTSVVRLVHVSYDQGKAVGHEVIAEIGATRERQ